MRKFRPWTADEVKRASELYRTRGALAVQAELFPAMSCPAISQRMARHGVKSGRMKYREWTTLDVMTLRHLWAERVPRKEIAARLGVKESAVQDKALALRLPKRRAHWTPGQRRMVDQVVDREIYALAQRLGKSEGSIVAAMTRSLVLYRRRNEYGTRLGKVLTA